MYQVIEYNDYRKENYIRLHGVTSDLEKAKQRVQEILKKYTDDDENKKEDRFYEIYQIPKDHRNDYVALIDKNALQYTFRLINFEKLLGKTIRELYVEMLEEKIPKTFSSDEIIAKDVFRRLIDSNALKGYLDFLQEDVGVIGVDTYSTIIAISKCDEF